MPKKKTKPEPANIDPMAPLDALGAAALAIGWNLEVTHCLVSVDWNTRTIRITTVPLTLKSDAQEKN